MRLTDSRFARMLKTVVMVSLLMTNYDLRYARLLEAITKSALATCEEVAVRGDRSDKHTTDQIDHSRKLTAIQMDKLTTDIERLQITFNQLIKKCNDRIQQQEDKFDDFKAQV